MVAIRQTEVGKASAWDRAISKFGAYFESKGLGPADIPAAMIVHELLGAMMAAAAWVVSQTLLDLAGGGSAALYGLSLRRRKQTWLSSQN